MDSLLRDPVLVFALNEHNTLDTPQEKHLHDGQQRQHKNIQLTPRKENRQGEEGQGSPVCSPGNVDKSLLSACSQNSTHDQAQCTTPTYEPRRGVSWRE